MSTITNSILREAEDELEAELPAELRDEYMTTLCAAMKIAMHGGTISLWAAVTRSEDPIQESAYFAVNLLSLMREYGSGHLEPSALWLVANGLLIQTLSLVECVRRDPIDDSTFERARHVLRSLVKEGGPNRTIPMQVSAIGGHFGWAN